MGCKPLMNACGSKAAAWAVDLLGFGSALWDARRHGCWIIWERPLISYHLTSWPTA
jgi:hypothetical protein